MYMNKACYSFALIKPMGTEISEPPVLICSVLPFQTNMQQIQDGLQILRGQNTGRHLSVRYWLPF